MKIVFTSLNLGQILLPIFLFIFGSTDLSGQSFFKKTQKTAGAGFMASSSGQNPFWLRTNQYGTVPVNSNLFYVSGSIYQEYDSTYNLSKKLNKFNFGYGLQPILNIGKATQLVLPDAYFKVRYGIFEGYVGNRREISGLVDSTLSSGAYAISNNALPFPKIQIAIPNYWRIAKKLPLSIKGDFSIGHLGAQYYVKNQLFHKKTFYARIGNDNWPIQLFGGFNHQFQFGGKLNNLTELKSIAGNNFPNSFRDFLYAVTGISLNKGSNQTFIDPEDYTSYDLTNRVGNHFGSIDIATSIQTKAGSLFIYRQSVYDDGGLFYLNNISDGLNGVSFTFKKPLSSTINLKKINVEYFNSSSQGGPIPPGKEQNPQTRGADNYFNHGQFIDGWAYNEFTLGSPYITPHGNTRPELPKYVISNGRSGDLLYFTNNNRVKAINLGIMLSVHNTEVSIRNSFSQNFGTYRYPFAAAVNQTSTAIMTNTYLPKYHKRLMINVGWDNNGIYKKSFGTNIGISHKM